MASTLCRTIFEEGEARGKARGAVQGKAEVQADAIIRILGHRMGSLDPAIRKRIRRLSDFETLAVWYEDALRVTDAEAARRLADKIQNAPA